MDNQDMLSNLKVDNVMCNTTDNVIDLVSTSEKDISENQTSQTNLNMTELEKIITSNPNENWDFCSLSKNYNISYNFILNNLHMNWCVQCINNNLSISYETCQILKKHIYKPSKYHNKRYVDECYSNYRGFNAETAEDDNQTEY